MTDKVRYAIWDHEGIWAIADNRCEALNEAVDALLMDPVAAAAMARDYLSLDAESGLITDALYLQVEMLGGMRGYAQLKNGIYCTIAEKEAEEAEEEFQKRQMKLDV